MNAHPQKRKVATLEIEPRPLEKPVDTFSGQSANILRELVLTGQLETGKRLNEVELAKALGISRGPLREAINVLKGEGLLTSVNHRGTFVRTFNRGELRDLYEVRIALETHALRIAPFDGFANLNQLVSETRSVMATTTAGYPRELDFHDMLMLSTGNDALVRVSRENNRQILIARSISGHDPERAQAALQEHIAIVQELVVGNRVAAQSLLEEHWRTSLESVIDVLST